MYQITYFQKKLFSFIVIIFITLSSCSQYSSLYKELETYPKVYLHVQCPDREIKAPILKCEVAKTQQEQTKGLMFRKSLSNNACMLFIYHTPKQLHFWMKNTSIPLSISFIDNRYKILAIHDLTPHSLEPISSPQKTRYAIEVNQGWYKKHNITQGCKVIQNS